MHNSARKITTFILLISALGFSAQSVHAQSDPYAGYKYRPGQGFSGGKFKLPPRPSCVREVKSTIKVTGTFDGNGCLYTWKGKDYKKQCFAPKEISEGLPPMFSLSAGATLKNLQIECALDGVHTTRNNRIDSVIFRDVEEDAITVRENITVTNSQFWYCNDKCIQMNSASNSSIRNNQFFYSTTSILANWGYNISVVGNSFYNTRSASIRSHTSKSLIRAENNTQDGGTCLLMAREKGVLEDLGGNVAKNVTRSFCEVSGGKIVMK